MNKLDRLFLRIARMSRWNMRRIARDGDADERRVARLCLIFDYSGQRRESNGQFGTGKKAGGSSSGSGKRAKGSKKSERSGSRGEPDMTPNIDTLDKESRKHAREMSLAISSGEATLRVSGMKGHISGTPDYYDHEKDMAQKHKKTSTFNVDYTELIPQIMDALKNRTAHYSVLKNGELHAKIDCGRIIGITYKVNSKKPHKTTVVTVVHSTRYNDWHFYPDEPDWQEGQHEN